MPAKGFFTDTTVCIGCKACEVACKEWNQLPDDGMFFTGMSYDNTVALGASTWRHVEFIERPVPLSGQATASGDFSWLLMSDVCKHCQRAGCLENCPTGAIVRTYAWVLVLGNTVLAWPVPMLFTERGVLVGLVHFSMPTMILVLAAALSHIDPVYERAAASLGASPARVFRRVTLPLSMPGIVSGGLIVFAWTLSAFPTPELLGGGRVKMIANVVKDLALDSFNWPGSAAFAAVALVLTLVILALTGRVLGKSPA